jgi:hypothetical protein
MSWDLAKLAAWTPEHLLRAVPFPTEQAMMWPQHFQTHLTRLVTMDEWEGNAANAAVEAQSENLHTAVRSAEPAAAGATALTETAGGASAMHAQLMDDIGVATGAGFEVQVEPVQVNDPANTVYPTEAIREQREEQARVHAQMIAHHLTGFKAALQTGAQQIRAQTQELQAGNTGMAAVHAQPHVQMGTGGIQLVDNRTGPGGLDFDHDPITGDPIGQPPPGQVPDGKQWWYHPGTGWTLQDHLKPCDGNSIAGDVISVLGGLLPPTFPGAALTDANAIRAILHVDQCEGP